MVRTNLFAVLALAGVAGCELGSTVVARSEPTIVIHSVLNPASRFQEVLVESSLTGARNVIDNGGYDAQNPIVSGNGIPISGALVKLTDPDGVIMTGTELRLNGGPTGIYQIRLDDYSTPGKQMVIQPGRRYELSVSAIGLTVTGSTLVPNATKSPGVVRATFNRDRDTAVVTASDAKLTRALWLRVEAPVWPYSLFTLDGEISVAGNSRNIYTEDLIRIFYPGFEQRLTVAAVDSNIYDYYRSGNDPFSGTGLITHLSGGLGLFGSVVVVAERLLDVTQDPSGDPIENRFTLRSDPTNAAFVSEMTLYLEASGRSGGPDRISGRYLRGASFAGFTRGAVFGTRLGTALHLQLLNNNATNDVRLTFEGSFRGDSLIGVISPTNPGPPSVYVRVGK